LEDKNNTRAIKSQVSRWKPSFCLVERVDTDIGETMNKECE